MNISDGVRSMGIGDVNMASPRASGTQAVERALNILTSFSLSTPDLGINDLSRMLDLTPSTVHRLVRALVAYGFLEQDESNSRYKLGRNLLILGRVVMDSGGLTQAQVVLERVGATTGESVNLGVLERSNVVVILRVESQQALRFTQVPGTRVPFHASSMGKSLLAFCSDWELELERLARGAPLERFTASTIVNWEDLRQELVDVRRTGFSLDREESLAGVRCLGVPVLDAAGIAKAAIAIQAPSVRMPDDRVVPLAEQLWLAADEIAVAMGLVVE